MFITIKITVYYYSLTGKDLGDWSPEKDCCWPTKKYNAIIHQCALSWFMSVTLSDVSELPSKMTIKSCLDPVPASVLKQCISVLLPVMTLIVNQSV